MSLKRSLPEHFHWSWIPVVLAVCGFIFIRYYLRLKSRPLPTDTGISDHVPESSTMKKKNAANIGPNLATTDKTLGVTLTGTQETLLATLFCKWYDCEKAPRPILGDPWAGRVLRQLNYDFSKLGMNHITAATMALRARIFDDWTFEFIQSHLHRDRGGGGGGVTVLHLGCGLDGRTQRLHERLLTTMTTTTTTTTSEEEDPSDLVGRIRWVDVDLPDVVELRRQLSLTLPLPTHFESYRLIGASVTGPDEDRSYSYSWLESIPAENPTLIVFEGLTMYLTPASGRRLLRRLTEHFSSKGKPGQFAFDALGSLLVRLQNRLALQRATGAVFSWAIDDVEELTSLHERLRIRDDVLMCERHGNWELPFASWAMGRICAWLPYLRYLGHDIRMDF